MNFNEKLNIIDQNTSNEQKKMLHFKSLRNFIYYYDVTKKEKRKITELLEGYILFIEKNNYSFTLRDSINTNKLFIQPLGDLYRKHLGFSINLHIYDIFLVFGIANIFILSIFQNDITRFCMNLFFVVYFLNYLLKYKRKKIWGLQY